MKQIIFLATLFLCITASAQRYYDSTYTVTHDSTYTKMMPIYALTTHDSDWVQAVTEDTLIWKCNWYCQHGFTNGRWVTESITYFIPRDSMVTHDTLVFRPVTFTVSAIHDTTSVFIDSTDISGKTEFGAKIQQDNINDQLNVAGQLGLKWIRYGGEQMDTYTSLPNNLKRWVDEGYNVCVNIQATNTAGSNVVEYLHGSDTVLYKTNLRKFCQQFGAYIQNKGIKVVLCIENEPINTGYFTGPFSNYIAQLKMSVPIAHEFGLPITDGAMHLQLIESVMANQLSDQRAKNTKALLDAEKTNGVDFTNFHTSYNSSGGGFQFNDLVEDVQWIRNYTGKPVMSNENGSKNIPLNQEKNYIAWIKQAKVVYSMRWSGCMVSGNLIGNGCDHQTDALNYGTPQNGSFLTDLGKTFRDEIKKP